MSTLVICKNCPFYHFSIEIVEQHGLENNHGFKIIHTSTDLSNVTMTKPRLNTPLNGGIV